MQNTIVTKLLLDSSGFAAGMQKATSKTKQFGQQMFRTGRDLSAALTLPLTLVAKSAVETASGFELAQAKIAALSGASKPFADLASSARELGANTIFTAEEVSQLQLNLKKLGKSKEDIKGIQEPILQFAQALDYGIAESGEFVVQTLNRFKDSLSEYGTLTEQASFVTNVFAAAAANSAVDAEKLRSSLNYVGSEAAAAGFSLEETTALIGLLADRGFDASRGGTALRRILAELAKQGFSAEETIDQLLDTSKSYREELEEFGLRGGGPAAAIGGLRFEFELLVDTLRNSEGFTQSVADVLDNTLFAGFRRVASAANEAAIAFGLEFAPAIKNVSSNIAEAFKSFSKLPKPIKAIVVSLGLVLAAIGPLALGIGALTLAFGSLSAVILANPLFAAAAAIITVGTALNLTKDNFDENERSAQRLNKAFAEQYGIGLDVAQQTKLTNTELQEAISLRQKLESKTKQLQKAEERLAEKRKTTADFRLGIPIEKVQNLRKEVDETTDALKKFDDVVKKTLEKGAKDSNRKSSFIGFFPTELTQADKAKLAAAAAEAEKIAAEAAAKARAKRLGYDNFDVSIDEDLQAYGFLDGKKAREAAARGEKRIKDFWDEFESKIKDIAPDEEDEFLDEFSLISDDAVAENIARFEFLQNYVNLWGERIREIAISIGDAFSNFFVDGITQSKSWAESFKENIVSALEAVLRKVIALTIAFGILNFVSGGVFGQGAANFANAALGGQNFGQFLGQGFGFDQIPGGAGSSSNVGVNFRGAVAGNQLVFTTQRGINANYRIYG